MAARAALASTGKRACRVERGIAASTPLLACSACAGDYEDPDRTAWPDDAEKADSRGDEQEVDGEKIPAEER